MQQGRQQLVTALDRRTTRRLVRQRVHHGTTAVDVDSVVGEPEHQPEGGVLQPLGQGFLHVLRLDLPGPKPVEELLHRAPRQVAAAVEPTSHLALEPRAQRAEGQHHCGRGRRRAHRRTAAQPDTPRDRHRQEQAGEHGAERQVQQRSRDQAVDVVEPVAEHGDADRDRDAGQGQPRGEAREQPRPLRTDHPVDDAEDDGDGDGEAGQRHPLQLLSLHTSRPSEADDDSRRRQRKGQGHPEEPDKLQRDGNRLRQRRDRRHVLERRVQRVLTEHPRNGGEHERAGSDERRQPPAGTREVAVGEQERDRHHPGEERRPAVGGPDRGSPGPGWLEVVGEPVRGVGVREPRQRQEETTGQQQPPDHCGAGATHQQHPDHQRGQDSRQVEQRFRDDVEDRGPLRELEQGRDEKGCDRHGHRHPAQHPRRRHGARIIPPTARARQPCHY